MKYFISNISAILFSLLSGFGQPLSGSWFGELEIQSMKLPLVLHITQVKDSLKSTMDSPMQEAKGIPVDITTFINHELSFEIKNLTVTYIGKLNMDGKQIEGTFTQGGRQLPLTFKKSEGKEITLNRPQTPKQPFTYNVEEVSFANTIQGNTLAGTLTTPKGKKNFPVVVMITGSGPQDRDETLFGHKPFLVIADHFTNNGIGVLRLDDRGVGASSKGKIGATSADFATDINAAVMFLKEKGYKKIGLVGHSEGGMIAPMVANENKDVKFIVSMAGPGIPIDGLMALQTYAALKSGGADEDEATKQVASNKRVYQLIKNYKGDSLEKEIKNVIAKEIEQSEEAKSLSSEKKEEIIHEQTKAVTTPWFLYFIRFNPQDYLSKIKIPVLAINGSKDVQVIAKENLEGIKKSLTKASNKNFETIELPGLNHLFQEAKTGGVAEYAQIEQTISPKVLDIMTKWILKNSK